MAQETNHSQVPLLCSNGCGFYGNPRTNGLCSVCYKEHLQRQNNSAGRNSPPVVAVGSGPEVPSTHVTSLEAAAVADPELPQSTQTSSLPLLEDAVSSSQAEYTENGTTEKDSSDCTGRFSYKGFSYSSIDKGGAQPSVLEEQSRKGKRKHNERDLKLDSAKKDAASSDSAQNSSEEQELSPEKAKRKKNRCFMCRKKTGYTGFECRCGNIFCGPHRYSDVHSCSYDYKADAAEKIRKENPVVVAEKIQKI